MVADDLAHASTPGIQHERLGLPLGRIASRGQRHVRNCRRAFNWIFRLQFRRIPEKFDNDLAGHIGFRRLLWKAGGNTGVRHKQGEAEQ